MHSFRDESAMADIQTRPRFNLLDLPNELLSRIFETLCLHCQSDPDVVVDYDTRDAWESKRCLARICRVSQTACSVAQPVLYHYYSSGNMQKITGFREIAEKPEEDDLLPGFLSSTLRQPKLARAVRVLSFAPGSFPNGIAHDVAEFLIDESLRTGLTPPIDDPSILLEQLGPRKRKKHETVWENEVEPNSAYVGRIHHWLQGIAISNCPFIEQLHISYRPPGWLPAIAPKLILRRLRIIAVTTGLGPHVYAPHISRFVDAAPNLKSLYGGDIDFTFELGGNLSGLQKLSINGSTSGGLEVILSYCTSLQDLEYHQDPFLPSIAREANFAPVSRTLRRLCFSVVPHAAYPGVSRYGPQPPSRDTSYFTMLAVLDKVKFNGGVSVQNFGLLEILEIDYFLLYGRAREVDERDANFRPRLASKLPSSIRILHIGFVTDWKHFCGELIALASEIKAGRLAKLEIIRVDVITSSCIFEFYSAVEAAMSITKVEFVLGLCPTCSVPRGMLPGRPAGADVPPESMVNYNL